MKEYRFGQISLDPARNPAVLDSLTWDAGSLIRAMKAAGLGFWEKAATAAGSRRNIAPAPGLTLHEHSAGRIGDNALILAQLADGQHAVVEFVKDGRSPALQEALLWMALSDGGRAVFYRADSRNIHALYAAAAPERLPQALPRVPRLGVGTRMSRAQWPGIWQASGEGAFFVNGIQNSQRELNLLENVLAGSVPEKLYYPGIGLVPEGHTGSTFEGLWLCGVSEALKANPKRRYGADADHIMVKRGPGGMERARKVLAAARYYSFFTIDVSDLLDYAAFPGGASQEGTCEILSRCVPEEKARKEVLSYYRKPLRAGARSMRLGETDLARLIAKYWRAIEALESLIPFIRSLRGEEPFDLELSIDEHPPEIEAHDCLTSEMEFAFILAETRRRGLPLTHLAPNLGVEKHLDYRHPGGIEGLMRRTRALQAWAQEQGVVIDCHSGDDLSERARRALNQATAGLLHFKISPSLQSLFGEVLFDFDRSLFALWWDDTLEFARENASQGSRLAAECIEELASGSGADPDPKSRLFRLFGYATVGKRDERGGFLYRDRFYSLPQDFYVEYTRRMKDYLCLLATDLFS
jgi:hypothetical protein